MKKYILIICVLILTGCTVEYNLDFKNEQINEKIIIKSPEGLEYEAITSGNFAPIPAFTNSAQDLEEPKKNDNIEYYDIKTDDDLQFIYKFNTSNYQESYFANGCYSYFKIFEEEDKYIISVAPPITCLHAERNIENLDVSITTNHKVTYNNADEIKKGKYIWHINNQNKSDKSIQISFEKATHKDIKKILIITGASSLAIILILTIFYCNYRKANKI